MLEDPLKQWSAVASNQTVRCVGSIGGAVSPKPNSIGGAAHQLPQDFGTIKNCEDFFDREGLLSVIVSADSRFFLPSMDPFCDHLSQSFS